MPGHCRAQRPKDAAIVQRAIIKDKHALRHVLQIRYHAHVICISGGTDVGPAQELPRGLVRGNEKGMKDEETAGYEDKGYNEKQGQQSNGDL